jgi:predicted lysophospholipase L1 biosynthesis ABC-type transport system permease subunit
MGRVLLVARLAARDLRRRPAEAALLLLAIAGATTTLTLGLVLRGVIDKPYQRTRVATAGPDVLAALFPRSGATADRSEVKSLTQAPGVVAHSGPYPFLPTVLEANGRTVVAQTQGRDTTAAAVDQPMTTKGGWVRDGGVVIEAAFAEALGVSPGDRVTLKQLDTETGSRTPSVRGRGPGRSLRVAGVAVTAATPPYPEPACVANLCQGDANTGVIWLTKADAVSLAPDEADVAYVLNLKLADPATARAFAAKRNRPPDAPPSTSASDPPPPFLQPWQDISAASANLVRNQRRALMTGSWLLALLAVASLAVLVGGRMADQMRRVGLLKAVGGTPGLIAAVLLAQYVVVALLAAAAGLALGSLTAPLLTDASAGLLGSAGARTAGLSTIGIVTTVALAVAVAATLLPAIRASRTSAVLALADAARPPRRTAWLIAVSARLPVPLLLGLRVAGRRPRRTILGILSIAITVSGIVAALAAHADIADGANHDLADRLNQVLLTLTITLIALAAVNAIFITWATALDARRSSALARALGATSQQVSAGLSAAQVLPALAAAILGIPGGIALIAAVDPDGAKMPPLWELLAVVPCTALIVAGLTVIPARISARRPVAEILQSELA